MITPERGGKGFFWIAEGGWRGELRPTAQRFSSTVPYTLISAPDTLISALHSLRLRISARVIILELKPMQRSKRSPGPRTEDKGT